MTIIYYGYFMKRLLSNRKNQIICLIIALEITACSFTSAGIYNLSNERYLEAQTDAVNKTIAMTLAGAAGNLRLVLDASRVQAIDSKRWKGPVLTKTRGTITGPSGKETYYNLNMDGVVAIMRRMGNEDEYWIRDDGCRMLGDYIMVAADLDIHPRGSLVDTSLGKGIVCDTGTFTYTNPYQLDIAVTW